MAIIDRKRTQLNIAIVLISILINFGQCELQQRPNRYLAHLFNKYGSHGTISFEGLEHLMHNLGLGGLEFNPTHTIDEHRPVGFKLLNVIEDAEPTQNNTTTINTENGAEFAQIIETTTTQYETPPKDDEFSEADESTNGNVFRLMHDPKHRHPRHHDHGQSHAKTCLSPQALIELYVNDPVGYSSQTAIHKRSVGDGYANGENLLKRAERSEDSHESHETMSNENLARVKITPNIFMSMCPALLVQIEQGSCNEQTKTEADDPQKSTIAWASATASVFLISICGLVGIAIVPLTKSSGYQDILRFLVSCAIGTLCGDALMHLLPHAMSSHGHNGKGTNRLSDNIDESDEAVWLCGCAFLSALVMYSIETLLPLIGAEHHHGHSHHAHSHSHGPKRDNVIDVYQQQQQQQQQQPQQNNADRNGNNGSEETDIDLEVSKKNAEENAMVKNTKNHHRPKLSPVAFMVIIGDGLHNITDGMAIGAAFGTDPVTGMATAFAVLCHELPHELGDFALLLQTGVSIRRAVVLNIISSILSFMGMIFGLVIAGVHSGFVRWIYAGTAGTFLYIAMADLIPELARVKVSIRTVFIQIFGILLGGIIMLFIALNEDRLRYLFE